MMSTVSRKHGQAGFTLWELIVVVCLVVLLFVVAMENLLPLRGAAERAQVVRTVGALRSALGLQATERVLDGGAQALAGLAGENPLDWLAIRPPTDEATTLESIAPGHWAWLAQGNTLAYRLRYPQYVDMAYRGEWLRFRVRLETGINRGTRQLALEAMDPVRWDLPEGVLASPTNMGEKHDDKPDEPGR